MKKSVDNYKTNMGDASDEELGLYKQCFERNNSTKPLELLKWNHQENLPGMHSINYAIEKNSDEIAAIYTYLPAFFRCMNRLVVVMQSFDTLTDKNHRGKGLFIKLAKALENEVKNKGVEFVYGFPNENSTHGFLKKLNFHYFGEVPFLVKPLNFFFVLKRIVRTKKELPPLNLPFKIPDRLISEYKIKEIHHFEEAYDLFYNNISKFISIGLDRNSAFMNWRYINKPLENYGRYGIFEGNQLKGIVIFALKLKHGGKIGYLMELLFNPEEEEIGSRLLKFANVVLKKSGADINLAWCYDHSFNYKIFKKRGYFKFPEKLRPQKLGVIAKVLNSNDSIDILNIKNWYISYSDSDTV